MKKPVIGILSPRRFDLENPFENQTRFVDNFSKRIMEAGGIPIGLLFPLENFNEDEMKLCDGLVISGGPHLGSSHICALHFAYLHKIPVLGVCLGMQTMAGYEWFRKMHMGNINYDIISKNFSYSDEKYYLYDKEGHNKLDPFKIKDIDKSKHKVILDKDSKIYEIYKDDILYMPSLHNSMAREELFDEQTSLFKVTGVSEDKVVEVIESRDDWWCVGVQFHPELEDINLNLFKRLVLESSKIDK